MPSCWSSSHSRSTAAASNSWARTGLKASAPKSHWYGGNSQDQPSRSPEPSPATVTRWWAVTCWVSETAPERMTQKRSAVPPASKMWKSSGKETSLASVIRL